MCFCLMGGNLLHDFCVKDDTRFGDYYVLHDFSKDKTKNLRILDPEVFPG